MRTYCFKRATSRGGREGEIGLSHYGNTRNHNRRFEWASQRSTPTYSSLQSSAPSSQTRNGPRREASLATTSLSVWSPTLISLVFALVRLTSSRQNRCSSALNSVELVRAQLTGQQSPRRGSEISARDVVKRWKNCLLQPLTARERVYIVLCYFPIPN